MGVRRGQAPPRPAHRDARTRKDVAQGHRGRVLRVGGRVERQEGLGAQGEVGGEVHSCDSSAGASPRVQPVEGQGQGVHRGGDQGTPRAAAILPA